MAQLLVPFAGDRADALAERLLARFGTLTAIVSAPAAQLREAAGDLAEAATQISAARQLFDTAMRDETNARLVYPVTSPVVEYLRSKLSSSRREQVHAIFGDARQNYLADEALADGDTSFVKLCADGLLQRARAVGASGFVLAHNHPSGNCRPSESDVSATRRLSHFAQSEGLTLLDHVILTQTQSYSMKAGGQL